MRALDRRQIAWRLAQDIREGAYVNLGSGMPLMVSDFVPAGREVVFHSENGLLGVGPRQQGDTLDMNLVNAGNIPVTLLPGGAIFHHVDSFHMVRGGHLDISVLGAYQVSAGGDLANWELPQSGKAPAVGGAMDLAAGARAVWVMMELFARDGASKLLPRCTLPLTGLACVRRLYTDLGVFELRDGRVEAHELVEGLGLDALRARLPVPLEAAAGLSVLRAPDLA